MARINTAHPAFIEGYMAGLDDPGFLTKTQPETIKNPYPPDSVENIHYAAGYATAIR